MAYAFSWLVWSPWVLGQDGAGLLPFKFSHAASGHLLTAGIIAGPTLSAFIMTATTEGRAGVRRLLGRLVLWRVGIQWYLFALLGVPLIILVGTMIYMGELPDLKALGGPSYVLSYLGTFALVVVLGGPLFEEIGWRGFALPRMEPLQGPLLASVILPGPPVGPVAPARVPGPVLGRYLGRHNPVHHYLFHVQHRHDVGVQQHASQRASGDIGAQLHRHVHYPPRRDVPRSCTLERHSLYGRRCLRGGSRGAHRRDARAPELRTVSRGAIGTSCEVKQEGR
jgi:hypothetical protein